MRRLRINRSGRRVVLKLQRKCDSQKLKAFQKQKEKEAERKKEEERIKKVTTSTR